MAKLSAGGWIAAIILAMVVLAVVTGIVAIFVMLLWNSLVPDLFDGPEVTFLQAWGLLFLIGMLGQMLFRSSSK